MSIDFYVEFSGDPRQVSKVLTTLNELSVRREHSYCDMGQEIRVVTLDPEAMTFTHFLEYLQQSLPQAASNVLCTVWYIDSKSAQGNGELKPDQIKALAKIGATFCWTMFNES